MTAPARRGSGFALDPELAEVLARWSPPDPAGRPAVGDVEGLRRAGDAASAARASLVPAFPAGYPLVRCSRFSVLDYPMLNDRTTEMDEERAPFLAWRSEDNGTAWGALLGDRAGGNDVAPAAAPARESDQ